MHTTPIAIVGGGLSGLLLAFLLQNEGLSYRILEARNRLGGRILTLRSNSEPPVEMGATWLGKKHNYLLNLLDDLDIDICEQYMGNKGYYEPISVSPPQLVDLPPNEEPSYRIEGGTDTLVQAIANRLDPNYVLSGQAVRTIQKADTGFSIETQTDQFTADFIISTLPPKLLVDSINFSPSLPVEFIKIASHTHTWMAESIKVALTFEDPFWRNPNSSGTIFSNVGPVSEMYDHSNSTHFALKGFMNNAYHAASRNQRKQLVLNQLHRFYGDKVDAYLSYRELAWQNEPFTYHKYREPVIPHQHNGHAIFNEPLFDGRFLISGSETATAFPGYMDGAVESAWCAFRQLRLQLKNFGGPEGGMFLDPMN